MLTNLDDLFLPTMLQFMSPGPGLAMRRDQSTSPRRTGWSSYNS